MPFTKIKASWIALGFISLICFIAFKDYLLLKKAYFFYDITSDGFYLSYPYFYNTADYIAHIGIPKWTFKAGMGQSIFPFMFRDPFSIIIYIIGNKNIPALVIYIEVLKIILSGLMFFHYLRLLKLSNYTSVIGCLLFSFCGFITEGSPWFCFSFEAFNLAMFLLAFELLYNKQKWFLFPFAVFLICISMPFNLYIYGVFMTLYAVFRHLQTGNFDVKKLGGLFLHMLGLSLIGILLAGPFLLENIVQLLESPRVGGANSISHQFSSQPVFALVDKFQLATCIYRFFSNDILGSGSNCNAWGGILGAPMVYCGLPCLLLLPQVFGFLTKRLRALFIVFISVWLLPVIFPYLRYAFWLFTGDYYRIYSFFVAVVVLYYALLAMDIIFEKRKINTVVLLISLQVLLVLLFIPFFPENNVDSTIRLFTAVVLILYTNILLLINKVKNLHYLKYLFFIVVFYELCYTAGITANRRDAYAMSVLNTKFQYNNYFQDAVKYIQSGDNSFYRIDKSFEPASARYSDLDYSLREGYNSTSSYNPFNQLYYIRFLQTMGVADKNSEQESRWAKGLLDNPILESENSVKYFMTRRDSIPLSRTMWDSVTKIGDVKIYKNKFLLPFGFTYRRFIKESDFSFASLKQKEYISLKACVVNDTNAGKLNGLTAYQPADTLTSPFNFDTFRTDINNLSADTLAIQKFTDNYLAGKITATKDEMLYLSIPFDKGWHLNVDGKKEQIIVLDGGMSGVYLTKGMHNIEMVYKIRYWNPGLWMSLAGVLVFIGLLFGLKKSPHK